MTFGEHEENCAYENDNYKTSDKSKCGTSSGCSEIYHCSANFCNDLQKDIGAEEP